MTNNSIEKKRGNKKWTRYNHSWYITGSKKLYLVMASREKINKQKYLELAVKSSI